MPTHLTVPSFSLPGPWWCDRLTASGIYGGDENALKSASLEVKNMAAYLSINEKQLHVPLAALVDYAGMAQMAIPPCFVPRIF